MSSRSNASAARFMIQGPVQSSSQLVSDFDAGHPGWLDAHASEFPIYRLPTPAIETLQRSRPHRSPILQGDNAAAELDFTSLCDRLNAVGVWNGQLICYPYLTSRVPLQSRQVMRQAGFSNAQILQCQQAERTAGEAVQRLKGYAGWLTSDQRFLCERDELRVRWQRLALERRPSFPFQRSISVSELPIGIQEAGPQLREFQAALNSFLDRWGLTQMATWDLPEPQGPLVPALLPPNAPALPRHGLHIVLPIHYPLTTSDDLLRRIQQQQVELARANNLDLSVAGLPHFEVLSQMLEVEHLERVIRCRYGRNGQGGGFVTALENAIAETLSVQVDHVKRLRKGISACKRGRRSTVRWLRPPAGSPAG